MGEVLARALDCFDTPFYLFDEAVLAQTIHHLEDVLPRNVELCYAMKANPFIVAPAARLVGRIEVCSPGELRICQMTGVPAHKIVVSGVHKDRALMKELVENDDEVCRYTVESRLQYRLLEELAHDAGKRIPVILRLTSGNQFGLDVSDVRELTDRCLKSASLEFCGVQYFSGTQRTSARRLGRELARLDALMEELATTHEHALADGRGSLELEFGAGLPVEYFEQDEAVACEQEDAQLTALAEGLANMRYQGSVALELGRAIAAACGTYATSIVDTKRNKRQNYAIVDGGMHQLVYYGHAMSLRQPVCEIHPARASENAQAWSIYGSLCTTNDALAKQIPLADVQVGDVLLFKKAGAYCMTEGLSLFLSRDLPRVIMANNNGALRLVRDRIETFEFNAPQSTGADDERNEL